MSRLAAPQRRRRRYLPPILLLGAAAAVLAVLLLVMLSLRPAPEPPPQPDPHEGQVYINDGSGMAWYTPEEGVPVSELHREDFSTGDGQQLTYTGTNYRARRGVDVSAFQGDIDWNALRAQGIEFVCLRIGYRGYVEGVLHEDSAFEAYYSGAKDAGLDVGVYFFSQARNVYEAAEEGLFVLGVLEGRELELPVYFDWEPVLAEDSRTADYDGQWLTAGAAAFCNVVEEGGYEGGVYLNRQQGYYRYDLSVLADRSLWVADYGDYPDFYYAFDVWQYSDDGTLDGVDERIDLDMLFERIG